MWGDIATFFTFSVFGLILGGIVYDKWRESRNLNRLSKVHSEYSKCMSIQSNFQSLMTMDKNPHGLHCIYPTCCGDSGCDCDWCPGFGTKSHLAK